MTRDRQRRADAHRWGQQTPTGIEFTHGSGLTVINNVFDTGDDDMNFRRRLGAAAANDPSTRDAYISATTSGAGTARSWWAATPVPDKGHRGRGQRHQRVTDVGLR